MNFKFFLQKICYRKINQHTCKSDNAEFNKFLNNIIPLVSADALSTHQEIIKNARILAIEYTSDLLNNFSAIRESIKKITSALTIVRIAAVPGIEDIVTQLALSGVEIVHIVTDYCGMDAPGPQQRFVKDIIRSVHLRLVDERIRDEITIIVSGGIAMAEHVPKAIICGADLTAVDIPLLIALGALLYEQPEMHLVLPDGIERIPVAVASQRIVNLMGAWHSQLLEVMGAMGIREARRLRGETGRAIFFDEIDKDTFGKIFQQREAANL